MPDENRVPRRLSVTEFRRDLYHWIGEVEAGRPIELTRRGRAVVRLVQAEAASCHTGDRFGIGGIKPLLRHPGILESLWDDRGKEMLG